MNYRPAKRVRVNRNGTRRPQAPQQFNTDNLRRDANDFGERNGWNKCNHRSDWDTHGEVRRGYGRP